MKNNSVYSKEKIPNIAFWGVFFILLLPVIVLPPNFQPSDWTRTILFRSVMAILAGFLLYKYFYKNDLSISLPKWKLSYYLPFLILSAFILLVVISTIFSQDPRFSFFGSPGRAGGSLNLLFYFLFSVFLAIFIKDRNWNKLWKANLITAFLASVLAIIQSFNLLKGVFISYEGGGVPSFLGNSTFLAIYIFFMAILAFIMLLHKKNRKQKMVYGALFLVFILTIFFTNSRATYLALLVSFFFLLFFYPFKTKRTKALKIIAGSILIFAVIIIFVFNFFPQLAGKNAIFSRLSNRLSIGRVATDLVGTRFAVWQITLQAIKEKPLLGWGPENFYIGFEKYYRPAVSDLQRLWWDRPHNVFLEIAVSYGLAALFCYISFWLILLWKLQKFKSAEKSSDAYSDKTLMAHGLQAMIIGYLITLFFNFDSFPTYLISFFLIGYSFYLLSLQKETVEFKNNQKFINYKNKKIFLVIFSVILLLFVYFWNIKPLFLNLSVGYASSLSDAKKCGQAMAIIESINKKPGILIAYSALTYSDIIKNCSTPEKEVEYAKKGLEALKKASEIQPKYTRTWLFMGVLTDVLAAREQDADNKSKLIVQARDYLNKALELSPKRQEILAEMERNYLMVQDYQTMKKIATDCIDIDSSQGVCYWYLGISEIFLGDQTNGKKHVEESLEKKGFIPAYIQLGAAYLSQNNYKDAADAYSSLVMDYSNNASYHAVLAVLLQKTGDYKRASQESLKVIELQPDNEEAKQFLQLLVSLAPNDPVVHASMATAYREWGNKEMAQKEFNTAKSIYLQLIAKDYNNADYHYQIAGVYQGLKEFEKSYQEAFLSLKLDATMKAKVEKFIQNLPPAFWIRFSEEIKK